MSFVIGAVTLPRYYTKSTFRMAADANTLRNPGNLPIVISYGGKVDVLTVEALLYVPGQTQTYLNTTYITPLRALIATEVAITDAGETYSGENFIFMNLDREKLPGATRSYFIRMEFWRGDVHIVI